MSSPHATQHVATSSIPLSSFPAGAHNAVRSNDLPPQSTPRIQPQRAPRARNCTLIMNDRTVQRRLFNLILATVLLLINLAIYLAFVVTRALRGPWLYLVLIFLLLALGFAWSHALFRFIRTIFKFRGSTAGRVQLCMDTAGTTGYAQPDQPIHVTMAGDEDRLPENRDAAAMNVTIPPPAYGIWRSSVRLNPDLLFWQRVNNQPAVSRDVERREERVNRKAHGRQLPSYISNDGVDYVVEAQPQSFTENPQR
ncbi:hypothetical protein BDV12DRAFT_167399 [Aspergillus spectabilis]